MKSDAEIISEVLKGDHSAYEQLVKRYQTMVRAVAISILRDSDWADDAAQEAFVLAFEKLAQLRNRNAFAPWIARITQREAHCLVRQISKSQELHQQHEPSVFAIDSETLDLLSVVSRLPKHERLVVQLKYFSGWSTQEIAEMTCLSIGTITKRLSRAYQRLRCWLEIDS